METLENGSDAAVRLVGDEPRPKPLPWWIVAVGAALTLALLGFLTLYLPARTASIQGNTVRNSGFTFTLTARPDAASRHTVALHLLVQPTPPDDATVEMTPVMPTMGNMTVSAHITNSAPGQYDSVVDLTMGGQWEVAVRLHRAGRPDATAQFRLNA